TWLCVKINDDQAYHPPTPAESLPRSVISGRRIEELSNGVESSRPPTWIEPMLATLVDQPFSRPGWIFEPKLDGERCLAYRQGNTLRLFSRNRKSLTALYPEIVRALKA